MNNNFEFLLYKAENEDVAIDALVQDESVWLTQKAMAELFGSSRTNIVEHIQHIYADGELDETSTCRKFRQVRQEGNRSVERDIPFYNLDMIISVGYRVNSRRATQFRIWATSVLKDYMIKGFAMNDEFLKQGKAVFGKDYFRELLERVRSIRASERRVWQQITDIFAECSIDYDKDSPVTRDFYAMVQNKFHYAITGMTAAELISSHADSSKENMGLTTWKAAPEGRILKSDSKVAKNYLTESQLRRLERTVSGYFDYIEDLIERENTFTMEEFASSVNEFLAFRKYDILEGRGHISMKDAQDKAAAEYDKFNKHQKIVSDFDKEVRKMIDESNGYNL